MALVFHRRLVIPLCAIAFFAVALTARPPPTLFRIPPTTLFVIAALGVAAVVFLMPGALPRLRTSRALVRVRRSGHRDRAHDRRDTESSQTTAPYRDRPTERLGARR